MVRSVARVVKTVLWNSGVILCLMRFWLRLCLMRYLGMLYNKKVYLSKFKLLCYCT